MAITSAVLLDQVRSAAPFLLEGPEPQGPRLRYLRVLRRYDGRELDALAYYELCLCAHWATAGSFVPTDVDNAIRWKLWQDVGPERIEAQARLVLEAASWDYRPVTARRVETPEGVLSTHEGTWFSVAAGAYAACARHLPSGAAAGAYAACARVPPVRPAAAGAYAACAGTLPDLAAEVLDAVRAEAEREDRAFEALRGDPIARLKGAALVAHNFGDLDRVIDQWALPEGDPLRVALYDAARPGSPLFGGRLGAAGALHQKHMSADNHRHYPLREARCLRRFAELLLPVGPFFDDWGRTVARHPALSVEEKAETMRVLVDGWTRLHEPPGYARALSGMLDGLGGGRERLKRLLTARDLRALSSGSLKVALGEPQARFEARWAAKVRKL